MDVEGVLLLCMTRKCCCFPRIGIAQKVHVLSGLFDQIIHSTEDVDMAKLFRDLHPKVNYLHVICTD